MSESERFEAWNLLFVTKVNVCYWKSMIALYEKWYARGQYLVAGITLTAAVIALMANRNWVTTLLAAVSGFVITIIGIRFAQVRATAEAKMAHERWSQLCSDAEVLWRHGKDRRWDDPEITRRAAALIERDKQYQAREYHNPNRSLLAECEALVRSQMTSAYGTKGK